jgi:hypothetical protein
MKWGASKAEVIASEGTDCIALSSPGGFRLRYIRDALGRNGVEVEYLFTTQGVLKGGSYSVVDVSDLFKENLLKALESKYGAVAINPIRIQLGLWVTWNLGERTTIELVPFGGELVRPGERRDPPEKPSVRVVYSDLQALLREAMEEENRVRNGL